MNKVGRSQGASGNPGPSKRSQGKTPAFDRDVRVHTPETVSMADSSPPATPTSTKFHPILPGLSSGQTRPSPAQHSGPPSVPDGEPSRLDTTSPPLSPGKIKINDFDDPLDFQRAVNGRFEALTQLQRDFDTRERMEEFEHRVEEAAKVRFLREYGFQAPKGESVDAPNAQNYRPLSQATNATSRWRGAGGDAGDYWRRQYPGLYSRYGPSL